MFQKVNEMANRISEPLKHTIDGTAISAWVMSLTGILNPLITLCVGLFTLVWLAFRIEELYMKRKSRHK